MININVFKYFFIRELKDKYLGNITGLSWILIQPLIMLFIYWLVFDKIFHSRVPEALEVGFIVYLAIGLWPWLAFSESINQSIPAVIKNSDLIGKNKIDLKIPVLATITANYVLNIFGYFIVLLSLSLFYKFFSLTSILLLIYPLLQLYILAVALGFILSSLQIFIRDILQFMTTIMTLWFFLTPIIYSETILPEEYKSIIRLNPLYTPISYIHKAIITHQDLPWAHMLYLSIFIVLLLVFSIKLFNKLSNHFEDFK